MMISKSNLSLVINKFSLFCLLCLFCSSASAHKFYVSLTEMNYNQKTKSLEVSIKIFIDDIEDVLELENESKLFVCTEKEAPEVNTLLHEYTKKHFQILKENTHLNFEFIGKSCDQDYIYLFAEYKDFNPEQKYTLKNTLLTDDFHEQHNKVNYLVNGVVRSFSFTKDKTMQAF